MDTFLLRLFQRQVAAQCFAAIFASETAQSALNPPASPRTPGAPIPRTPPHQDVFWASVQNCLTAVANVSKTCWGEEGKYRKERKPLRQSLGIKKDNPLKPISMRNNFEHVDEWIDEWFATSTNRVHVDCVIGPPNVIGGVADAGMFRVFDTTTAEAVFWGGRYSLKTIMDEITRLYPIAKEEGDKPSEGDKPHSDPPSPSGDGA